MIHRNFIISIAVITFFVSGCSQFRPKGEICKSILVPITSTDNSGSLEVDPYKGFRKEIKRILDNRVNADVSEKNQDGMKILALSAGGQWGAFGSGFLKGWSARADITSNKPNQRPEFDIVTGVSTGAIMCTFAFLGKEYDRLLEEEYTSASNLAIFQRRSLLTIPFSNSIFLSNMLRRRLEKIITPNILNKVANEWKHKNRGLFVGAANLDSGGMEIFNLTKIASDETKSEKDRQKRYIDCILAAAAIPVVFPPVFIDGNMFVDGAARQHMITRQIEKAAKEFYKSDSYPVTTLYMIINGDLKVTKKCVKNNLFNIGFRSINVVIDQLLVGTMYRTFYTATQQGWKTLFVSAADTVCLTSSQNDDQIDPAFMKCIFTYGEELGRTENPWSTSIDDLDKSF